MIFPISTNFPAKPCAAKVRATKHKKRKHSILRIFASARIRRWVLGFLKNKNLHKIKGPANSRALPFLKKQNYFFFAFFFDFTDFVALFFATVFFFAFAFVAFFLTAMISSNKKVNNTLSIPNIMHNALVTPASHAWFGGIFFPVTFVLLHARNK